MAEVRNKSVGQLTPMKSITLTPENPKRKDREKYVIVPVTILKLCGQWFYGWKRRYLEYSFKILFLCLIYIFPMIGEIGYLVYNRSTVAQIAEGLYLVMLEVVALIKFSLLHMQGAVVMDIMRDLNSVEFAPKCPEHDDIFRKTTRTARIMVSAMVLTGCGWAIGACSMPLFAPVRVHPTNTDLPGVDVYSSPFYEMIFFYHVIYKSVSAPLYCSVELLPASFMFFAIEQLKILAFDLENMFKYINEENKDDIQDKFSEAMKQCIRRHKFVLNYVSKVQTAFTTSLAIVFILTGIVICLTGVKIMSMGSPFQNPIEWMWTLAYLLNICYSVYVTAYAGNEITLKSKELMNASFNSPWVEANPGAKRLILIFREKCKKPITLEAGFLCQVNLNSFTNLMNWSYKAYALLNTMGE